MGIGSITASSAGAVTEPTGRYPLVTFPSPSSTTIQRSLPVQTLDLPEMRGVLLADGVSALWHVVGGTLLRTGPLAPSAALTAASTSVRATASVNNVSGTDFADGDEIKLYDPNWADFTEVSNWGTIRFKTTLSAAPTCHEVKRGTNVETTLANLAKLVNGTGTQGVEYMDRRVYGGGAPHYPNYTDIESSSVTATVCTFRSKTYGTTGNGNTITEVTDSGGVYTVTAWANGAAGTGTSPAAGDYRYAYAYFREADNCQTAIGPTVDLEQAGNCNVNLSVIATGNDSDMDMKRWFRTTDGGAIFYRGYDIATAATTDVDDRDDDDLTATVNVIYDPAIHRPYESGYPPKVRCLARYKGRVWGGGALLAADTANGPQCTVTQGSTTVVLDDVAGQSEPTKDWEGRVWRPTGYGKEYRIVRVDPTFSAGAYNGRMYLDRAFEEGSGIILSSVVRDDRDPYELFFSEPMLVNNWPPQNSIKGVTGKAGTGITALIEAWESLIVFTADGVWRVTGDGPTSFAIHQDIVGIGCVGPKAVVMVDGTLFWLAADGIYAWGGSGNPVKLSSPGVAQDGSVRGIDRTIARLNLAVADHAVAVHDHEARLTRWFVPLDSDVTNRWAIVYDHVTGAFALDTDEDVTACAVVPAPDGSRHVVTGDVQGVLQEIGVGTCDGLYGIEPVTATDIGCTGSSVIVTGSPAYTSAVVGCPAWVIDSSGNFTRHRIYGASTGSFGATRFMTALSAGLQVVVGGILGYVETGWWMDPEAPGDNLALAAIQVLHDVGEDGEAWLATGVDQTAPSVRSADPKVDLTTGDGERRVYVRKYGSQFKVALVFIEPGTDIRIHGLRMHMRRRESGRG